MLLFLTSLVLCHEEEEDFNILKPYWPFLKLSDSYQKREDASATLLYFVENSWEKLFYHVIVTLVSLSFPFFKGKFPNHMDKFFVGQKALFPFFAHLLPSLWGDKDLQIFLRGRILTEGQFGPDSQTFVFLPDWISSFSPFFNMSSTSIPYTLIEFAPLTLSALLPSHAVLGFLKQ